MSTTLPLFWDLSSASKKDRINASVKLVGALEQFQANFVPQTPAPGTPGSDEDEDEEVAVKRDELDLRNTQDVSYSIRRLIRGLASPRESSRLGFAVALTELLSRIDTVTCSQILNLISESTKHQGSMSGQEERDVLFARLFGIMSVIQSGLAVRIGPLPTSVSSQTHTSTVESYEHIVIQLLGLSDQKSWLRESAWFAISLAVDALYESDVSWKEDAVEKTLHHLFIENKIWSTEKFALALKLQDLYPGRDWKTFLSPIFKLSDLFSTGNLTTIARILKESTTDEDGLKDITKAPSGAWRPQLNFAWDIILDQLLPGPNVKKASKGSFQDFYRVVVDESLFSSTSSPQRKYWGFQVFQKALTRVTEANMPMLFTKNFMRSWINHLSKRDRYLHKVAHQTVTEVQEFVKDKPQLGFAVILQLTDVNGNQQFDKLTRTKTVESILASLDAHGIQQYIDYLIAQTDNAEENTSNIAMINSQRAWVIDSQLGILIQNGTIPKEDAWVKAILDWLVIRGLFIINKESSKSSFPGLRSISRPAFSDELRRSCRLRLLSCLSDLNKQANLVKSADKSVKTYAVASDGDFWIAKVISTISQLEEDKKHVALLENVEEEEQTLRLKAKETVKSLRKISGEQHEAARGAELLILGTLLQHYCAEGDENRYTDALETCLDGASRMLLPDNKRKKKDRKTKELSGDMTDEPVDILVDTIIGFLEKSTAYIRTVGNQVFSLLSGSVKDTTIDLILAQLERRDPSQLVEDDDDEVMEDSEIVNEEEEDSEVSASDNEDEESHDDSGDDSDGAEVDLELRNKIEEALRVNGIEPATGETDSEDEELMDDDQMMAIDEQLAQVFRSRTNENKGRRGVDAQREATHFKNRVLDLVDIFLKKQSSSPYVLRLMIPLIDLFGGSSQDERQLSDKAKGILRSRFSKAKEMPIELVLDQVLLVASNIHAQARKAHSSDLLSILSLCSIYLSKALVNLKAEPSLLELYKESLADFATRKNSCLNPTFFQDFLRRFPTEGWCLRQDLLTLGTSSINPYRQGQILQLLELLVKSLPSISEGKKEVVEFMPLLRQLLLDVARDSCSKKNNFTTAQMKDLFKLGLTAIRQTNQISPETVESIWQPQSWKSLQENLVSSRFKNSPSLHKMCEQIVRMLQKSDAAMKGPTNGKPKRGIDEISGEDLTEELQKNKRKKMKGPS